MLKHFRAQASDLSISARPLCFVALPVLAVATERVAAVVAIHANPASGSSVNNATRTQNSGSRRKLELDHKHEKRKFATYNHET